MKRILLLATTLIGLTVMLASCGNKEPYIAVVSKGFQHKFWVTVRDGAEAAAKQNGVKISFVGPETESDSKIQQDTQKYSKTCWTVKLIKTQML